MAEATKMTYKEVYEEFCKWSPEHSKMAIDYRPWGTNSIVVWFKDGYAYKVKYHAPNRFIMQMVSDEDINRKFNSIK